MEKRFWIIIGVIVALFAGILWYSSSKEAANESSKAQPTNHIRGNKNSKVKLVEYGDFQCSACAQYYPLVEETVKKYQDKIAFQFRHLPISQIHQNAYAASRAAEAAGEQGKFWDMYNILYQNQQSWANTSNARPIFEGYAQQLGLNLDTFKKDFASSKVNDRINADKNVFNKTGLQQSTPTFLLNDKKIQPASLEDFSKLIDAELKKQGQ